MKEVAPGIFHWRERHPRIEKEVDSFYLRDGRVLIDPMEPSDGVDWFADNGPPTDVLLTNRHHYRGSARFVEAFDCTVRAHSAGMHEFGEAEPVEPYEFGDELPGGLVAHEVGSITPEETALHAPDVGALALADAIVTWGDRPLSFVPDSLLGDDPEGERRGMLESLERLLELDFEHLLLAHGGAFVGDGRERLKEFVDSQRRG